MMISYSKIMASLRVHVDGHRELTMKVGFDCPADWFTPKLSSA